MKKICLITGATDGIGKATAIELVNKGFKVVMAARDKVKAELVKREIESTTGSDDVDYLVADFKSLRQIHKMAATFRQSYRRLDVLVNNAGIFVPTRTLTEDGYESTFQVNYLSHFLLTRLLLEELKTSKQGRIINLSSSVYSIGNFDVHNLQSEKQFSVMNAYSASKLFMLLFTIELAKQLRSTRVTVNAVDPGVVRTNMMMQASGVFKLISYMSLPFSVSPKEGAETSIHLATSEKINALSGFYFKNSKQTAIKTKFNTDRTRQLLWDISDAALSSHKFD